MTTVVCLKVKPAYGPEYVNRLAAMVARQTTVPHRFLCLTDDPAGLTCPSAPVETNLPGWWAKLVLFRPHPELVGQRVVFLDLDTVIVGNMDFLFDYEGPFAILRDFYRPSGFGSAIMSIAPNFAPHVWERFRPEVTKRLHGDQNWLEEQVERADRWQDLAPGKIGSYKADQLHEGPREFAVCCFHGEPKPADLPMTSWVHRHWQEAPVTVCC